MLVACLVGAAVYAALPTDKSPTLRQAVLAAGVPASSAPVTNLNTAITGWSWACDADNYTIGYFVENAGADPALFGKLWIDRYDAGKKKWMELSYAPLLGRTGQAESNEVETLFWDGYYLYVELKGTSGDIRTLQFARDLTYRRQFYGETIAGLTDGALFYHVDSDDPAQNDFIYSVFDPESGATRHVFPIVPAPPVEVKGEQLASAQYVSCAAAWFKKHAMPENAKHPLQSLVAARANLQTDALAFAISYGGAMCDNDTTLEPAVGAVYVYSHPGDPKRMRVVEIAVTDARTVTSEKLNELLTKQSLSTLFGPPSSSPGPISSTSPSPSVIPSPSPFIAAPILGAITLGEGADGVLRRFGLHARGWSGSAAAIGGLEFRLFPSRVANVVIGLLFNDKIKLITVKGPSDPHTDFADPYGVRLGDSVDRLTQIRGTPDSTDSNCDLVYGSEKGVHWFFGITNLKITSIGVADGP